MAEVTCTTRLAEVLLYVLRLVASIIWLHFDLLSSRLHW